MTDEEDIDWTATAGSFKYRAAAVVRDGERLLVCAVDHIDGWFLPGGRVQFGETSAAALARELREELELDLTVPDDPLLIAEGIRGDAAGAIHQEICFYYTVRWPDGVPPGEVHRLTGHRFRWIGEADLSTLVFLPPEITPYLSAKTGVQHLAFDRR
jgi:8-oxo-dGTP pyrophosphatase MutT (NUDIX family)